MLVIHDDSTRIEDFRDCLSCFGEIGVRHLDDVVGGETDLQGDMLVLVRLAAPKQIEQLRSLNLRANNGNAKRVFAVTGGSRREAVQAGVLGATGTVPLPLRRADVQRAFFRAPRAADRLVWAAEAPALANGLTVASDMVSQMLRPGAILSEDFAAHASESADAIAEAVAGAGIGNWLRAVRTHHSHTFRHCLLVTGYATAFAQSLRFSKEDRDLLFLAGLVHDVGKAEISLDILDKPGQLDESERAIIRTHPELGHRLIGQAAIVSPAVRDVVLHHHELLDGTGYPDGLMNGQIGDLVRLTTIADIFAALVESRSYKTPMDPARAYQVLQGMGNKLDKALVAAFRPVAQTDAH